jgi:hypothetical protein
MDAEGLFLYPSHTLEWKRNEAKLRQRNNADDPAFEPVLTIKAIETGLQQHVTRPADEYHGLERRVILQRGSPVILTLNLHLKWKLYNGARGTLVHVVYLGDRSPASGLPDFVMVRFPNYRGPPWIPSDPKVVPLRPELRHRDCPCRCSRTQLPLKLAYALTIHKCQGMTVGLQQEWRYVVVHPGDYAFECRNVGAFYVAMSRARSAGKDGQDPDFAFEESFILNADRVKPVLNSLAQDRAKALKRLQAMTEETEKTNVLISTKESFDTLAKWAESPTGPPQKRCHVLHTARNLDKRPVDCNCPPT